MKKGLKTLPLAFIALTSSISLHAADVSGQWPQWRGPQATGVAPASNPPVTWSETENVKWKVKIPGEGHATPVIWGDKVFVLSAVPTGKKIEPPAAEPRAQAGNGPQTFFGQAQPGPGEGERRRGGPGGPGGRRGGRGFGGGAKPTEILQFTVMCLDRKTGKVLWQQVAREEVPHEGRHQTGSFSSPSAVTDGEHVLAHFGSRGLYCYDMDGKLQWSQDLGDMQIVMGFGEGSSPALYKNTIILNWDAENGSFVVALDKKTGKTLWKEPRDERTTWATPLIVEHEGKAQAIIPASGKIRSYDVATGKMIWECGGLTPNVIPTPVAANGVVYCTSGFRGNALLAIKLGKTGDLTDTDAILWRHGKATPYVPSPMLYGDRLYFFSNNNAVLSCFDAKSGKPLFSEERIEGLGGVYASPVGAGSRVYLAGREGAIVVIKDSDKLEVLATNKLDDKFDASPAVVGNELFLRGHGNLYCLAETKK